MSSSRPPGVLAPRGNTMLSSSNIILITEEVLCELLIHVSWLLVPPCVLSLAIFRSQCYIKEASLLPIVYEPYMWQWQTIGHPENKPLALLCNSCKIR